MREGIYKVVSVKGGKFHYPENPVFDEDKPAWTPVRMKCGRVLEPQNFFQKREDADRYTGGRLDLYECKHCRKES